MGDFKSKVKLEGPHIFLEDTLSLPMAKPCVRLPKGQILLPSHFDAQHGVFAGIWSPEILNDREALTWSLWMTATWATFKSAPELLPYVDQLCPRKEWRLGRVVRPGYSFEEQA